MATITNMTVCAGGEHVTLHVIGDDGKPYTVACLASELAPTQAVKESAIVDAVKADIAISAAKTFDAMKTAVVGKVYAEPRKIVVKGST